MDFKKFVRDVNDFPKQGVVFKDITPLLKNPEALQKANEAMLQLLESQKIDYVVGMESRGFFFAPMLAARLEAGFIPVRKNGKLPHDTITASYSLEYGDDTLEMHTDSISKGDRVMIHDDVLATGGTARAVCDMVEKLGGEVVQCVFLLEIKALKGEKKLNGFKVTSLMEY